MKTRLLKKLRKQAHNSFRIMPECECPTQYRVETKYGSKWDKTLEIFAAHLPLDEAIKFITRFRDERFKCLAIHLINERRYKKNLKQVKRL